MSDDIYIVSFQRPQEGASADDQGKKVWTPEPGAVMYPAVSREGSVYGAVDFDFLRERRMREHSQFCLLHMMFGRPALQPPHCATLTGPGGDEDVLDELLALMDTMSGRVFDIRAVASAGL